MTAPESTAEMPPMMYGTAWKKERTADLVYQAIKAGFRGIDTAAMKKHYDEAGTGEGIRRAISEGICSRKDLFIQTKFTPLDSSSSHSPTDPIPTQIHASLTSSLANLSTPDHHPPYLDALILHSPFPTTPETLQAWSTLALYLPTTTTTTTPDPDPNPARAGRVLRLGISNVTLPTLHALSSSSDLPPPTIIQNRFRAAEHHWDTPTRAWCTTHGAAYQGFWTLTGNAAVWQGEGFVARVARGAGVSLAGAWYALLMVRAGVVVLNGTGDGAHMREDLGVLGRVGAWRGTEEGAREWERCAREFAALVGDVKGGVEGGGEGSG
ncbi:NADP-dependent oxidoreductase domain-containing protein [Chaetomium tenue]|uniref:NADP-dependent oxidoreductase domain-containing protein n=1 Tax=Chaetomium tenue TaxID=1854479 RepID=A0ACB7NZ21_9PEZI|nr:NADP-dependent oxidoreductase domain-containing protein [Chaetomium globosum]